MGALVLGALMLLLSLGVCLGFPRPGAGLVGLRAVPWTVLPGFGLMLAAYGLQSLGVLPKHSPIAALGFVVLLVGVVLLIWDPRWWGPRWYREQRWAAGGRRR